MQLDKWTGLCIEDVMGYERCVNQCKHCKNIKHEDNEKKNKTRN